MLRGFMLISRLAAAAAVTIGLAATAPVHAAGAKPQGTITKIMVIDLENESYGTTFGATSPATYLNGTLLKQGELVPNWYATGHVSLDNYVAQISGQGSTPSTNSDCINAATIATSLVGTYFNVAPGTDASDNTTYPGQVVGDGCVFPAPNATAGTHGAMTIGEQIDLAHGYSVTKFNKKAPILWRQYSEDMGNDAARDNGDADAMGGRDCAHPILGGADNTNGAEAGDQYATRHNGFMYFHSVIDNQARCDAHVVPLGTVSVGTGAGGSDVFAGHLAQDLQSISTTPLFSFITPNLCNDGHDASCKGVNTEGGKVGGLAGADLWLKHWMPMIFASPAYQSGKLLVVLTFDEGSPLDTKACPAANQADCNAPSGPNLTNYGYSPVLGYLHYQTAPTTTNVYPGGGQVGAVLFNKQFIKPGSVNSTGYYNHFSALRSYEDLLGITTGGADGHGHLGWAAQSGLVTFGADVFNK